MHMAREGTAPVLQPVRPIFRALATTIVPEAWLLDERGWAEAEAIVERALADRPPAVRRQLVMFMRAVNRLPLVRYGHTFTNLDDARRERVLLFLQRSPVLALRRGVWGVRTLVYMGYYARPAAAAEIGYRANALGWMARQ